MGNVQHLPQEHCFVSDCGDSKALLEYTLINAHGAGKPAAIDFTHTFVPPECRGKGVAEQLVRAGIKWAREQGYELRASCWYAAKFIRQK
jgi:predicted GNAT family acetyltransferase